jgi:hypothetical protein
MIQSKSALNQAPSVEDPFVFFHVRKAEGSTLREMLSKAKERKDGSPSNVSFLYSLLSEESHSAGTIDFEEEFWPALFRHPT